jgi:hypothetical protein
MEFLDLCPKIPETLFDHITARFKTDVSSQLTKIESEFAKTHENNLYEQKEHLRHLRPGLANPTNKPFLEELNVTEKARYEKHIDLIDDVQLSLIDLEMLKSQEFYKCFLNNLRAVIKIFKSILYNNSFIALPGDEISDHKHANIKLLTA